MSNKTVLFLFLGFALLIAVFIVFLQIKNRAVEPKQATVALGGAVFLAEISEAPEERIRGLSGRESIPVHGGMLFLFDEPGNYAIWMKDMRFPIDIIWIRDGRVAHIVKNAPAPDPGIPDARLSVYRSDAPADAILEIRAGTVDRLGIKIADLAEIIR